VLYFEVRDGVFDDGAGVDVGGVDDVGDVAVHEDVAGLETEDGGFGDTGVGAAEPEDTGRLSLRECWEEFRILMILVSCPCGVGAQGILKGVFRCHVLVILLR